MITNCPFPGMMPWTRTTLQTAHIYAWLDTQCVGDHVVVLHYVHFELAEDLVKFQLTWS